MKLRVRHLMPVLLLLAAALAPSALAGPNEDFAAVYNDYRGDRDVTSCRFTREQLVNAGTVAGTIADFESYAPSFRDQVNRELARLAAGRCPRLRITSVGAKGGPRRESITIKNLGAATSLRGLAVRNRSGRRIRLPRSARLRRGGSLKVVVGCRKGRRRAVLRGSRYYACGRRQFLRDSGDVVRLVGARGVTLSQRGFGRYRGVRRF